MLKRLVSVFVLLCCLGIQPVYAQESPVQNVQEQSHKPQEEGQKEKKGLSMFWVVFLGAVLFVVSSATALNSMGGKPPPRNGGGSAPDRKKTTREGKERFRL